MKKTIIPIALLSLVLLSSSCGGKKEEKAEGETAKTDSTQTAETPKAEENSLADPFKDFPKDAITSKAGEMAFACIDIFNPGNKGKKFEEISASFGIYKVVEPGAQFSKIENFGQVNDVPNYFVVSIKTEQKAKKGDILLGPWTGGNMKRAVVTDDKDPAKPVVNFIDVDWDNPAKTEKGVGYGQAEVQLEPNTFHVITSEMEAGTSLAVKEGSDWKEAKVIKVGGDKIIVSGWAGKVFVVNKADCKAIEIKPTCKVGDEVMAPWVGKYMKMKVLKIDTKFARVYLKDPFSDKPLIVPFGVVTASL